ncbi:MAG TPA: HlyD family secretion protein [Thermodesulfovibrionales bacterium]|nr:HlyD family secretion protein [Thermodesulfovibrionales bacterium]
MEETKQPANNHRRNIIALSLFVVIALIGAVVVFFYLRYKNVHVSTDDAFVDGYIHTIASKVPGTVTMIAVRDNQLVKKGDILLALDPADYEVRVNEAAGAFGAEKGKLLEVESRRETAERQLMEFSARASAVRANLELQKANLEQAELDRKRAEGLFKKEVMSKERYEKTVTAHKVAVAQVKAAEEELKSALSGIETQKAVIRQTEAGRTAQLGEVKRREAQLNDAELKFGYSKIYAPWDGYITKRSVELGNEIQAGQPLMAVVPLDDIYITANYKETQLSGVRPGQKVEIEADTYPGKRFKGKVDSIMAGTGAAFSLFPPENATGNYVKVVQRIPVKIVIEKNADPEHLLRIGMSVVPTILIDR